MVIEWLKFRVPASQREAFIQADEAIWTKALAKYPGFLGKEVWINPKQADEVVCVIHWANRQSWNAVDPKDMEETERQFNAQLGKGTYELIEAGEYQVRKFAQPQPNLQP